MVGKKSPSPLAFFLFLSFSFIISLFLFSATMSRGVLRYFFTSSMESYFLQSLNYEAGILPWQAYPTKIRVLS